jgi:hypothetical protein
MVASGSYAISIWNRCYTTARQRRFATNHVACKALHHALAPLTRWLNRKTPDDMPIATGGPSNKRLMRTGRGFSSEQRIMV